MISDLDLVDCGGESLLVYRRYKARSGEWIKVCIAEVWRDDESGASEWVATSLGSGKTYSDMDRDVAIAMAVAG